MASYEVKKLCKKILDQTGMYCDPESFVPNRDRAAVETGSYPWSLNVDVFKSPALISAVSRNDYIGDTYREDDFVCYGDDYMKELIKDDVKLTASIRNMMNPHYPEREIKIYSHKVNKHAEHNDL